MKVGRRFISSRPGARANPERLPVVHTRKARRGQAGFSIEARMFAYGVIIALE